MNKKAIIIPTLLLIVGAIVTWAWTSSGTGLSPAGYASYVQNLNNGLLQEQSINDLTLKLQYKPVDYVAVQELRKESISKSEVEPLRKELNGMHYFNLAFRMNSVQMIH